MDKLDKELLLLNVFLLGACINFLVYPKGLPLSSDGNMLSIPEIATEFIDNTLSELRDDNSSTIFLVGTKSVGKTTLLYSFLDKNEAPRETLVLEYSFGRKSSQKQGLEKIICHVWEYGGKLDILSKILPSIPVNKKYYYCIMVDLKKIKSLWNTLETCLQIFTNAYTEPKSVPELLIIGGNYDFFKNYDADIKKFICVTLRSLAIIFNAHLIFYSSKEPSLVRRAKDIFHGMGFGTGITVRDKNFNFLKPINIPRGTDSWENINVSPSSFEQVKARHLSRFPPDPEIVAAASEATVGTHHQAHPEPLLDIKVASKYDQLRNIESLDIALDDYLIGLH